MFGSVSRLSSEDGGKRKATALKILAYGMLLFLVFTFGTVFELTVTNGVCFVYVISYFMALVVVAAIRQVGWRWTGVAVFLPYAVVGLPTVYMIEVVMEPTLIAPWAAVLSSLTGPLAGLTADMAFRTLPKSIRAELRSALTGMFAALGYFVFMLLSLAFLYKDPAPGLAHYLNGIYLTLPWLLVNGALGGYTAHKMTERGKAEPHRNPHL